MADHQLVALYQKKGDVALVAELFQRYTHLVVAVNSKYLSSKEDVEDATMQVFELLVQDLKKHEVRNFKPWLYSVVKNNALKFKKQNQNFTGFSENEEAGYFDEEDSNEKELLEMQLDQLEMKMKDLKEDQRECLRLFYLENRSYKEIMDLTGMDENKVKSHIQNGKRKLKIELEKDN
ncbi:MAG: sigma-70 family RNA polymerase sigma factor [Crocinitomicaceae bacterium]